MTEAAQIKGEIATMKSELARKEWRLRVIQERCPHAWEPTRYTPTVVEAHTTPGDAPGTMGIDWRGDVHVPRKETPRWTRVCRLCLKEETTTQEKVTTLREPQF